MNLLQVLHSRCFSKLTAEDTSQLNFWTEAWRCRETLLWEASLPFSTFVPFLIWDQCLNNLKELAPHGDKSSRVDPILERIHNPKKQAGWHKSFSYKQWLKNIGSTSFHHKFVSSWSVLLFLGIHKCMPDIQKSACLFGWRLEMKWYSFKEGKAAVFDCSSILNGDQFFKNRLCSHLSKIFPSWVDPFWKSFLIQRSKQESKNFPHLSKWPTSMKVVEWPRICKYVKFCLRWQSLSGYLHLNSLHKSALCLNWRFRWRETHTFRESSSAFFSFNSHSL